MEIKKAGYPVLHLCLSGRPATEFDIQPDNENKTDRISGTFRVIITCCYKKLDWPNISGRPDAAFDIRWK